MQRRDFTKNLLAASAVSTLSSGVLEAKNTSAQPAFKLKYAPHFGMFENSAGKDPIDQLKFMHEMGFRARDNNGDGQICGGTNKSRGNYGKARNDHGSFCGKL
jgi:hydroxypyruvate isomerase